MITLVILDYSVGVVCGSFFLPAASGVGVTAPVGIFIFLTDKIDKKPVDLL
jgi:hypothetical protein